MNAEKGGATRWAALFLLLALAAGLALWARARFTRFEVAGRSMAPALEPGDYLLVDRTAYRRKLPRRGHVVLAADPRDPARTLVKRVDRADLHGDVWVYGDNPPESTDSRIFGAVPRRLVAGRVAYRYWPLGRLGRVR